MVGVVSRPAWSRPSAAPVTAELASPAMGLEAERVFYPGSLCGCTEPLCSCQCGAGLVATSSSAQMPTDRSMCERCGLGSGDAAEMPGRLLLGWACPLRGPLVQNSTGHTTSSALFAKRLTVDGHSSSWCIESSHTPAVLSVREPVPLRDIERHSQPFGSRKHSCAGLSGCDS